MVGSFCGVCTVVPLGIVWFVLRRRAARPVPQAQTTPAMATSYQTPDPHAEFPLEVVGESHYQDNLNAVCGGRTKDGVDLIVDAMVAPEPDNPHDPNAVKVEIQGRIVGHLIRRDAEMFHAKFQTTAQPCRANIRGGWDRGGRDVGHYGVRLDLQLY